MNRAWLCLFSVVFVSQCGTQDVTGVSVKVSPTSPIVFLPDVTLQLGGGTPTPTASPSATSVTIKGAWFKTDLTITNSNSAAAVTFISIQYTINGSEHGLPKVLSGNISASDLGTTTTTEIAVVNPGFTSNAIPLIIQALPNTFDNFNLNVSMKLIGYYSVPSTRAPLDRLEKNFYFSTR